PREPLTAAKLAGVAVGIAGLVVVFWAALDLSGSALTVLAMLGVVAGALTSAIAQVRGRTLPAGVRIPVLVAWASLLAGVALVAVALGAGEHAVTLNGRTIGSVLYLGVTAAAGFLSMFWLLQRIGAVYVSLHALVVPLLALVWGAAFYGESLTLSLWVGAFVVAGGLVLVTGDGVVRARLTGGRARE